MTIDEYLGSQLRKARKERGISLEQAADALGFKSRNSVSILEMGKQKITVEFLISYCQYLGIDYIDLLKQARDYDLESKK